MFRFPSSFRSNHALFWNPKINFVSKLENCREQRPSLSGYRIERKALSIILSSVFQFYYSFCRICVVLNYKIYLWICFCILWRGVFWMAPTVFQNLSFCYCYYYHCNKFPTFLYANKTKFSSVFFELRLKYFQSARIFQHMIIVKIIYQLQT